MLKSGAIELDAKAARQVFRAYHKLYSQKLSRDIELLTFGHAGARVLVFPTSTGRFYDWEDRDMVRSLEHHIENGWIQLYCIDSIDPESWFNERISPTDRAKRHMQYHDCVVDEIIPFSLTRNTNPTVIATGASFGAYHAASIALRFPQYFSRVLGMSGVYDVRDWTNGEMNDAIAECSPCEYLAPLRDETKLGKIRQIDWIIPIGKEDPLFDNNRWFSQIMWDKGVWHAFREWDGDAHDWPQWREMIQHYIGGADSRD